MISDHHDVHTILKCSKPHPPCNLITFRKINDIDITQLKNDIVESDLYRNPATNVSEKVNQYDSILQDLLDIHAPKKTKIVVPRDN